MSWIAFNDLDFLHQFAIVEPVVVTTALLIPGFLLVHINRNSFLFRDRIVGVEYAKMAISILLQFEMLSFALTWTNSTECRVISAFFFLFNLVLYSLLLFISVFLTGYRTFFRAMLNQDKIAHGQLQLGIGGSSRSYPQPKLKYLRARNYVTNRFWFVVVLVHEVLVLLLLGVPGVLFDSRLKAEAYLFPLLVVYVVCHLFCLIFLFKRKLQGPTKRDGLGLVHEFYRVVLVLTLSFGGLMASTLLPSPMQLYLFIIFSPGGHISYFWACLGWSLRQGRSLHLRKSLVQPVSSLENIPKYFTLSFMLENDRDQQECYMQFLAAELCAENLMFLQAVRQLEVEPPPTQLAQYIAIRKIYDNFIEPDSPLAVNIDDSARHGVRMFLTSHAAQFGSEAAQLGHSWEWQQLQPLPPRGDGWKQPMRQLARASHHFLPPHALATGLDGNSRSCSRSTSPIPSPSSTGNSNGNGNDNDNGSGTDDGNCNFGSQSAGGSGDGLDDDADGGLPQQQSPQQPQQQPQRQHQQLLQQLQLEQHQQQPQQQQQVQQPQQQQQPHQPQQSQQREEAGSQGPENAKLPRSAADLGEVVPFLADAFSEASQQKQQQQQQQQQEQEQEQDKQQQQQQQQQPLLLALEEGGSVSSANVFAEATSAVHRMLELDSFQRFLRSDMCTRVVSRSRQSSDPDPDVSFRRLSLPT